MSGQISLEFGDDARAREAWARVLRRVNLLVDSLTVKEVAYRLNTQPSTLCDALAERERKNLHARQLVQIMAMQEGESLLAEIADALGYEVKRKAPLSPAEQLARLEAAVKSKLGQLGEELVKEALR